MQNIEILKKHVECHVREDFPYKTDILTHYGRGEVETHFKRLYRPKIMTNIYPKNVKVNPIAQNWFHDSVKPRGQRPLSQCVKKQQF